MKINGERLLILTNRFQRVMTNTLDLNETNFRILEMNILQIKKETNCFDSCKDDYNKHHGHYGPGRPWYRKPWYPFDKHDDHDDHDKHDKHNKHDKYDKYDNEHDKNHKQDKKYS